MRRIVEQLRAELPASGFHARSRRSGARRRERREPRPASREMPTSSLRPLADGSRSQIGPLKALQGRIWEQGYATGALKGEVYPDVRDAFARWTAAGVRIGIFSSGSVLAQKLLFANSTAGDLSPVSQPVTSTPASERKGGGSYRRIVEALQVPPSCVLFISDVITELDAAREAGVQTLLAVRPPAQAPPSGTHGIVENFDSIVASTAT